MRCFGTSTPDRCDSVDLIEYFSHYWGSFKGKDYDVGQKRRRKEYVLGF
jgi:hypothetical protein